MVVLEWLHHREEYHVVDSWAVGSLYKSSVGSCCCLSYDCNVTRHLSKASGEIVCGVTMQQPTLNMLPATMRWFGYKWRKQQVYCFNSAATMSVPHKLRRHDVRCVILWESTPTSIISYYASGRWWWIISSLSLWLILTICRLLLSSARNAGVLLLLLSLLDIGLKLL